MLRGWTADAANLLEVRVRVVNSGRDFEVDHTQSVLDAALAASWKLPHGCRGGNCGLCKTRLLQGEVRYPNGRPLGLSDAEIDAGYIVLCQARAASDLELELYGIRAAHERGASRLPCRIEQTTLAAHDVMIVLLRPPPAVDFVFQAGQYIDVLLPGDRRRSFCIASPPHDARLLELHVRAEAGVESTPWLFADAGQRAAAPPGAPGEGSLITIEGPMGRFYYREAAAEPRPLLLVGGGTGLAPLLSILRHVTGASLRRELTLYWGVRGSRDLYAQAAILQLVSRVPGMRYVPVLSEPEPQWTGRTGFVHAAVLDDIADLAGCDIYAAGPTAMIEALRDEFPRRGARLERLYCVSHA